MVRSGLVLFLFGFGTVLAQQAQYIGAGGCASSNCHGGTRIFNEKDSRIWGNEYSVWAVSDKHSKAYKVLDEPRGKRMAQILHISDAATDKRCAPCHVAGSPERMRSDGVSCEACHGPAEKWLGSHVKPNTHPQSVASGMIDTKDVTVRARTCLECHLGTRDKFVDHELIAAGHPDLVFELDTFSWAEPAHYRDPKPATGNTLPRLRGWAVGQSVALSGGLRRMAENGQKKWPEFSDLECYQCHHDLRAESWRIQRGYEGRKPGSLRASLSRAEVVRTLFAQYAPEQRGAFEESLSKLSAALGNGSDGPGVAQAAQQVVKPVDLLLARLEKQDFDLGAARALVKALASRAGDIAGNGVNAAEQATMSLDALTAAYAGESPQVKAAMTELYNYLEHPSTYQPATFMTLFRKAASAAE